MKMFAYDEICQGQGRSHSKSLPTFGFASWFPSGPILKMLEYFFSKQKWLRKVFLDKWAKIYIYIYSRTSLEKEKLYLQNHMNL